MLENLSKSVTEHSAMTQYAKEARDAIFAAKCEGSVSEPLYQKAMEICASHWLQENAVANTALAAREANAVAMFVNAISEQVAKAAQEEAGIVSWLYQASALIGEDLGLKTANAIQINETDYRYLRNQNGILSYFEGETDNDIKQFLVIQFPGCSKPLVVAGETKWGQASYEEIHGPKSIIDTNGGKPVNQRDPLYAYLCAVYMVNDRRQTGVGQIRREVGEAITQAYEQGCFMYLTVRGDICNQAVSSIREVFECR